MTTGPSKNQTNHSPRPPRSPRPPFSTKDNLHKIKPPLHFSHAPMFKRGSAAACRRVAGRPRSPRPPQPGRVVKVSSVYKEALCVIQRNTLDSETKHNQEGVPDRQLGGFSNLFPNRPHRARASRCGYFASSGRSAAPDSVPHVVSTHVVDQRNFASGSNGR